MKFSVLSFVIVTVLFTMNEAETSQDIDSELLRIEHPNVDMEAFRQAAEKIEEFEFDDSAEILGFEKEPVTIGGFSGIAQYNVGIFRGIKYAMAERFEMPEMLEKSDTIVQATESGPSCPQPTREFFMGEGYSEDCLYLDVYVPFRAVDETTGGSGGGSGDDVSVTLDETTTGSGSGDNENTDGNSTGQDIVLFADLPTIVLIKGETFTYMESKHHDARILARYGKAVVVIINYRTAALGFLSSGDGLFTGYVDHDNPQGYRYYYSDPSAVGNYGLYDQRTAIQWVKKYVGLFGGDPNKITLIGFSSGAESASAQMFNPMNDNRLFQRVILQSGVTKQKTIFYNDEASEVRVQKDIFQKLTKLGRCGENKLSCFKNMSITKLVEIAGSLAFSRKENRTFGPVKDNHYFSESCDMLQYEVMIGVTKHEAGKWCDAVPTNTTLRNIIMHLFSSNSNFHCAPDYLARLLEFEYRPHMTHMENEALVLGFIKFVTDYEFIAPAVTFANRLSLDGASTYMYVFDGKTPHTNQKCMGLVNRKATHGDDQIFFSGLPLILKELYSEDTVKLSKNYLLMLTNFAHTGNPNVGPYLLEDAPTWKPYSTGLMGTYVFSGSLSMQYRLFARTVATWTEQLTYLLSDGVCKNSNKENTSTCGLQADWEKNYKQWRDVDIERWRSYAEKYEKLAEKLNKMTSCNSVD